MNLHEYQAKDLLKQYGVPVPLGEVVSDTKTALSVASKIGGKRWVVKAQVHAGGRGKAGGVKIVDNSDSLEKAVKSLLGSRLVTYQTDAQGQPVNQVLIEEPSDIVQEFYLGAVIDRASQKIVFMASTEGGVEIEKVAKESPEKILTIIIDPSIGLQPYQARELFYQINTQRYIIAIFYRYFVEII